MRFRTDAIRGVLTFTLLSSTVVSTTLGQAPGAAAPAGVPAVGSPAPDFTLPGATRYGRLADPIRLSDFRGKTVVIAFFYVARTKG